MDEILPSKRPVMMQKLKGDIVSELKQGNEQVSDSSQVNEASSKDDTSEEELEAEHSPKK
jgi:hypothetical protein